MKKLIPKMIPVMIAAFIFSVNLMAQETTITVKVEKSGKVVKDTTYTFEDEEQAAHAMKMMDIMCEDDGHMMKVHKSMSEHHGDHSKTMVFVSKDGKTTEIEEMEGDLHETHGKHVVIMKSENGETYDILIDEDFEGEHGDEKIVKTKEIKVIISEDDDGEWTVIEEKIEKKKSKKQ